MTDDEKKEQEEYDQFLADIQKMLDELDEENDREVRAWQDYSTIFQR
jgi:hypothetical protein